MYNEHCKRKFEEEYGDDGPWEDEKSKLQFYQVWLEKEMEEDFDKKHARDDDEHIIPEVHEADLQIGAKDGESTKHGQDADRDTHDYIQENKQNGKKNH